MIKIKFKSIVKTTDKAICLERWCDEGVVWLPLKCIRECSYNKGIAFLVPEWLCNDKGLSGKKYEPYKIPKKIEPEANQEPIDELKF